VAVGLPQSVSYPYGGDEAHCAIGAPWHSAKTRGIIWGDGHAQHFAPLLDKPAQDRSISLLLFPGICLPIITKDSVQRHFPSSLSTINSVLSGAVGYYRFSELTKINLLVLAAAWQHYPVELYVNDSPRSRELGVELMRTGLDRLLQETSRPGLHTIVLSDVALQPSVAIGCIMATSGVILRRDSLPISSRPRASALKMLMLPQTLLFAHFRNHGRTCPRSLVKLLVSDPTVRRFESRKGAAVSCS